MKKRKDEKMTVNFKKEIIRLIFKSVKLKVDESALEVPPDPNMGDYALPCFPFAKLLKKAPNQIAEDIIRKLHVKPPLVRVDLKGPYVNFFINKAIVAEQTLTAVIKEKENYGKIKVPAAKKKKVMVEFPSPNTNKPLHLGHVRNILIGESTSRILEATGSKVIRANVNNDRGVHICKSMLAYDRWGKGKLPDKKSDHFVGDWYVKFNQELENNPGLEKEAQDMLVAWEKKDKKTIKLWKLMNAWAYGGFEDTYEAIGISFDKYYYESEYYDKGKDIAIKALKKKLFIKDKTGAIIAPLEKKYRVPDKFMLRADGTSIYITQDVFLAEKKFKDYKLDKSIYVVGSEQNLHFKQLFAILDLLGNTWAKKCFHLSYGMVNLPEGRMKSREGTVVDADDIIAEIEQLAAKAIIERHEGLSKEAIAERAKMIGLGALKFFILKMDPSKDMTYHPEESISFEGETGPYVQYSHARICSIFKRIEEQKVNIKKVITAKVDYKLLKEVSEHALIKMLAEFPDIISKAAEDLKPSLLANYMIRLSQGFAGFYRDCPILNEDVELMKARLVLSACVKQVLENGLGLLGIDAPEEM